MATVEAELTSLRAGQRRLFAQADECRKLLGDLREALELRDVAIARLELKLRKLSIELQLERLRGDGELPGHPARAELELA